MRSQTFGIPGTIGVEIRRQYHAWCMGCNDEIADVCPSRQYFEAILHKLLWRRVRGRWCCYNCAPDYAALMKESEKE